MDAAFVRAWVDELTRLVNEQSDELTRLDSAIGDGDHGVNLRRGFNAAAQRLSDGPAAGPAAVLTTVGTTLISKVGGAAGPLYGVAFREAGRALGDDVDVDGERLLAALHAALAGIHKLGGAAEGDKTIVDAFTPAVAAFEDELRDGGSLRSAAACAHAAAEDGMRATVDMQARKGRASYLGERSIGHQDPGATSTALLFAALARVSEQRPE